jgi:hypothetical protein
MNLLDPNELYYYAVQKLHESVPGPKKTERNKINFRCPICGDSKKSKLKKRGWLYNNNPKWPSIYCFNGCGSINIFEFLSYIEGISVKEAKSRALKEIRANDFSDIKQESREKPKPKKESIDVIEDSWIPIEDSEANYIIQNRKILEAPFKPKNWKLYYDNKTRRIVIPWMRNGKMVYHQKRSIFKNNDEKYLFPAESQKDINGLDELDESFPYIFLMEGVFDQIFVKNGVCVGGVKLTNHQKDILQPYIDIGYQLVWLLDNQNVDKTAKDEILKKTYNKSFKFFLWPRDIKEKDVNQFYVNNKSNIFSETKFLEMNIYSSGQTKLKMVFGK